VYALDLRNHGASPHSSDMSAAALVADLMRFLDSRGLTSVNLIGHSMVREEVRRPRGTA